MQPPRPMGFQAAPPPRGGFQPPQQQQQGFQPPQQQQGFHPPPPQGFQPPPQQGFQPPPQQQQQHQQNGFAPRPMPPQGFAPRPALNPSGPPRGFSPQTPNAALPRGPQPLAAPRGFQPPPQGFQPPQQQSGMMPPGGIFYGTTPGGPAPPPPQQQRHPPGFTPTQNSKSVAPSVATRGITSMNIDPQHQCPPQYCRFTFEKFPESEQIRAKAGALPLAAVFRPFCDFPDAPPVPPVNFQASTSVIRCRRCRAYVSPFSIFIDNGRRWQCALCFNVNEVEAEYYCEMSHETGKRLDYLQRAELCSGAIDIIAPEEYSLRPPPPPVFLFVIDVSPQAIRNGMLTVVSQSIKRVLSHLPGLPRTQVGFITFDTEIHFYDLSSGSTFRMLVVSELNAMFHPTSTDNLLVEVDDHLDFISTFLDQLPGMHSAHGPETGASALGPAIEAAFDIMAPMGGKMVVFQTQLPMVVDGGTDPLHHGGIAKPGRGFEGKTLGGPNEHETLLPAHNWYASKADVFNRQHISLDWYLAPSHTMHYVDVATTAELCHLTAGKLRFYPKFHSFRDGERMTRDVERSLTSVCCTEAVMRVRASTGVRVNRFFGSFTMRARDLIALPQSDADGVYGFEFQFENPDEMLAGRYVAFQSAVLYTTMEGERRIRVTNTAVPISQNPQEVLNGMQCDVVSSVLFKRAAEEAREAGLGLEQARNQIKTSFWKLQEAGLNLHLAEALARNLVGAIKSPALRGGTDVGFDERYYLLRLVGRSSIGRLGMIMRPKLVRFLPGSAGEEVPLTRQSLRSDAVFLLDNGLQLMVWLGSRVPSQVLVALTGVDHLGKIDGTVRLVQPSSKGGSGGIEVQLDALIQQSHRAHPEDFASVLLVREGDAPMEARFLWGLVNDPQSFRGGEITAEELLQKGRAPHGGGGGGPRSGPPPPRQQLGSAPMPPPSQPQQAMGGMQQLPRPGMTPTQTPRGPPPPSQQGPPRGPPGTPNGGGPMPPRGPPFPSQQQQQQGGGPRGMPPPRGPPPPSQQGPPSSSNNGGPPRGLAPPPPQLQGGGGPRMQTPGGSGGPRPPAPEHRQQPASPQQQPPPRAASPMQQQPRPLLQQQPPAAAAAPRGPAQLPPQVGGPRGPPQQQPRPMMPQQQPRPTMPPRGPPF